MKKEIVNEFDPSLRREAFKCCCSMLSGSKAPPSSCLLGRVSKLSSLKALRHDSLLFNFAMIRTAFFCSLNTLSKFDMAQLPHREIPYDRYQQILQYHLSQQDYQSVLACCRRFGLQDSSLWVQALWAGAKDVDMPSHLLIEILNVIEKERLLSPLLVIDALSNWNAVKVGDIRSYLQSVFHAEERLTDQDQALIKKYAEETARIRQQINNMQNSAIVFQGSRCCACNHQLELPSVHFLCQHSFHQHCFQSFYENENECPACLPKNKQIMDFIRAQEQGRDLHETFHSQLEKADDGFTLVADYFGRGVFNKLTIVNDPSLSK
ncbi:Vacuolar protein sorting-associated protein 11 [Homalodisca vitripennis]|nr:Vacuolar protein sorting-associated protein 11 [Homalodisca vitripennis]